MAQEVEFRDKDGTGMTLLKYDNLLLPKKWDNPPCKLEEVKNFSYKEGDVFLCSYPKTGSHWLAALVALLLRDVDVNDASTEPMPLIDMFDTETIAARPGPRATSTHLLYERLPAEHVQNKGKIILILRNPKDVAASFYHFLQVEYSVMYNGTWDYFLELFLDGNVPYGSYFDFVTSWDSAIEHHPDHEICVVFYEDLKQNSLKELRRLSDYLEVTAEESRLQAILDRCSLPKLKEEVEKKAFIRGIHDPEGKSTVYRKGEVGDWKNQMSVADSEKFDLFIDQKFRNCSFQFRYS